MTKRTARFLSAIAASLLAGAPLTTPSHSATAECLSGPKDQTPQGSHWYYRIDRPTKRHCWYLGDRREKASQASSSSPATSLGKLIAQKAESTLPSTVANARAELPRAEDPILSQQASDQPQRTSVQADTQTVSTGMSSPIIASRWPDQALPTASAATNTNTVNRGAGSTSKMQIASLQQVETLAAADVPPESDPYRMAGYSLPVLLAAIAGVLALAGFVTGLFLRLARPRTALQSMIREQDDQDGPPRRKGFARNVPPVRDRATEFFAQISRRHPI